MLRGLSEMNQRLVHTLAVEDEFCQVDKEVGFQMQV